MHNHSKKQKPSISCAYAHSLCVIGVKNEKEIKKNPERKQKKQKKTKNWVSHVNDIFYI